MYSSSEGVRSNSVGTSNLYSSTWAKGRVVAHYYRQEGFEPDFYAPYQIQLEPGYFDAVSENYDGLIFSKHDSDVSIRAATP